MHSTSSVALSTRTPVGTLRFNAESRLLLAAQTDGKVVVLDVVNGRRRAHLGNHGQALAQSFKRNGRWLEKVGLKVVVPDDPA